MEDGKRKTLINLRDAATVRARRSLLIAHRGGVIAPGVPENSLAAIRLAAHCGYDLVELDVVKPRDDEPVLFHDRTDSLLLNCGVDARLTDYTAQKLTTLRYRASAEPIATLAQAFALCRQLRLGVMLDLKLRDGAPPSPSFLRRIGALLHEYALTDSALTISNAPLLRAILGDDLLLPVEEDSVRSILAGTPVSLPGQIWFGLPEQLPDPLIPALQRAGVLFLPAINTFRYPPHAQMILAQADIDRLRAAGVDGFQIDSVYGQYFGLSEG